MSDRQFSFFSALTALKLCLACNKKFPFFDEKSLDLLARKGHKTCLKSLRSRTIGIRHAFRSELIKLQINGTRSDGGNTGKVKLFKALSLGSDYHGIRTNFARACELDIFPSNTCDLLSNLIPDLTELQHQRISGHYASFWLDFLDYEIRKNGNKLRYRVYSLWGSLDDGSLGEPLGFYLLQNDGRRLWFSALTYLFHQHDEPNLH